MAKKMFKYEIHKLLRMHPRPIFAIQKDYQNNIWPIKHECTSKIV